MVPSKQLKQMFQIENNIVFNPNPHHHHRNKQKSNAQPTTLVLGKTKTKTTNLVFLSINQMLRNASSTRQLDSGEFDLRI